MNEKQLKQHYLLRPLTNEEFERYPEYRDALKDIFKGWEGYTLHVINTGFFDEPGVLTFLKCAGKRYSFSTKIVCEWIETGILQEGH